MLKVRSSSKSGFHLVIPGPGGKFTHDCPNYHSLNVCSQSVAVAGVNGKLEHFTQWYRKSKKLPILTQLALKDISKGSGRKGSNPLKRKERLRQSQSVLIPSHY